MTLIKSILLGSAAGIVAVASAQAADLPTHKAAPVVQYVQICNVGGVGGWTLPGSDTCIKISGYLTAQVQGGNLNTQYTYGSFSGLASAIALTNPAPLDYTCHYRRCCSRRDPARAVCRYPRTREHDFLPQ